MFIFLEIQYLHNITLIIFDKVIVCILFIKCIMYNFLIRLSNPSVFKIKSKSNFKFFAERGNNSFLILCIYVGIFFFKEKHVSGVKIVQKFYSETF